MIGAQTMRVLNVQLNVAQRSGKIINLITFEDINKQPYVAEEATATAGSRFTIGKVQSFRISFPSNQPGKKDWIEYLGDGNMPVPADKIRLALAAFDHVSKYEIGLSDEDLMWRTIKVGNLINEAAKSL